MEKKKKPNKKDLVHLNFCVEKRVKEKLDLLCSLKGITKTDLITDLLEEYISIYDGYLDKAKAIKKEMVYDGKTNNQ